MSDIFISYKREDAILAKSLAGLLTSKGWSVWWDHDILAGKDYDIIIEQELNKSKCVIVLWSAGSVKSRNVKDEANVALSQNKLLPIMLGNVQPPLGFRMVQGVKWNEYDNIEAKEEEELVRNINQILSGGAVVADPVYKGLNKKPFKKGMIMAFSAVTVLLLIYLILYHKNKEQETAGEEPKSAMHFYNLGVSQVDNEKDFDEAINSFNEALNIDSTMAEAYFGRGSAYNLKGWHEEAIKDLEASLRLGYVYASSNLGWTYFDIANYPIAIEYFDQQSSVEPNALAEAGSAMCYFILGNYDSAVVRYGNAINLDPRFDGKLEAIETEYHWNNQQLKALKGTYTTWLEQKPADQMQ